MSLTVDKISDGTTEVDAGYVVNGSAKAWVRGQNDATVSHSLNISSSIDNGTGSYTYNFTNDFTDSSWAGVVTAEAINRIGAINNSKTAGSIPVRTSLYSSTVEDRSHASVIMGELA
jgi:hypothetical protein